MAIRNEGELTAFPADAVVDALLDAVGDGLLTAVAYDTDSFETLYVADGVVDMYGTEDRMYAHFEKLHSYVHLDFTEVELFQDELLPHAGNVRYLVTEFEAIIAVRALHGREGVFLSFSPDVSLDDVTAAVDGELD